MSKDAGMHNVKMTENCMLHESDVAIIAPQVCVQPCGKDSYGYASGV